MNIDRALSEPSKPTYFLRGDGTWGEVLPQTLAFPILPSYPVFQRKPDLLPKEEEQKQKCEWRERLTPGISKCVKASFDNDSQRILTFALMGFFLTDYKATLWLLFLIVAYPIVISFTRGNPMRGSDLKEIYDMGIRQIPVVGQIFSASTGNPSYTQSHSLPVMAPSKAGKPGSKRGPKT
jgi:hypothetical protein